MSIQSLALKQNIIILTVLLLFYGCGKPESDTSGLAELKITFHDTRVDGGTISRIDMTVLETQIIDINDNKIVISSQPQSFNLLEVTANNPVVLAHTKIAPGSYKQIRLILDPNTRITLTDGSTHPLTVPSGEQTGIKIDGVFSIPGGKLYTLDIDLDPGHSVHYAPGQGYMLKPVIEITGSEINSGNFYYAGNYNSDEFVLKLNTDGSIEAKTARYPKYVIKGDYYHDGLNQKLTVNFQEITCPSCSYWQKLKMKLFAHVPDSKTFDVTTFGADYIDLRDSGMGDRYYLVRVPTFSLSYVPPSKDFMIETNVPNSLWAGKTIVAQIIPEDGTGRSFGSVNTIPESLTADFDFSIPLSEFGGLSKDYVLIMAVVEDISDVTLGTDGTVIGLQNLLAHNLNNAIKLVIARDTLAPVPVSVPFVPTS